MSRRKYMLPKRIGLKVGPIVLLAVLTLVAIPVSAGKFYKWVDAEGLTHYSQHPPQDQSIKKEQIRINEKKPTDADSAISQLEKNRETLLKDADDRKNKGKKDPAEAEMQKARDENCQIAKGNLKQLNEHARIRETGEDGELRYLSEEEHQTRKDDNSSYLEEHCG